MLQCADATDKEGGHLDVGPVSSGGDAPQLADDAQEKQKPMARSLAAGHVDRIISSALPDGMHVSRDARIAFQKAATVSLLYLSCLAGDERARESKKRVTLSANDIRAALKAAGMTHLLPMLSAANIKRGFRAIFSTLHTIMLIDAFYLLTRKVDPKVIRLRKIGVIFFVLWNVNVVLGMYCECLVMQLNASIVLNHCLSIFASALACSLQLAAVTALQNAKTGDARMTFSQEHSPFMIERLPTLMSFASVVFLMFSSITVIGESLQHGLHVHDTSPILLVTSSILHIVLLTMYSEEIDLYDRFCGQNNDYNEASSLDFGRGHRNSWRSKGPLVVFSKVPRVLRRFVLRSFAPFTLLLVCFLVTTYRIRFLEVIAALFLGVYVFVLSAKQAVKMSWLLVNSAVREPSVVSACELAVRNVKHVDGVLQVVSSVFWEVSEGKIMALLRLRLMSAADPVAVTTASRKILEGVAAYVFVETYDACEENIGAGEELTCHSDIHSHSACSDHHHDHQGHDHDHHDHDHDHHDHDDAHGHCCGMEPMKETLSKKFRTHTLNTRQYANDKELMTSDPLAFPKYPGGMSSHSHAQGGGGDRTNGYSFSQHHMSLVPPPFPKPPT